MFELSDWAHNMLAFSVLCNAVNTHSTAAAQKIVVTGSAESGWGLIFFTPVNHFHALCGDLIITTGFSPQVLKVIPSASKTLKSPSFVDWK